MKKINDIPMKKTEGVEGVEEKYDIIKCEKRGNVK